MNECLAADRPGCNVRMNGLHALIQALNTSTEVVDVVRFTRYASAREYSVKCLEQS